MARRALPKRPADIVIRRWNHGIGRDMWTVYQGLGIHAGVHLGTGADAPDLRSIGRAVELLAAGVSWKNLFLKFNMELVDWTAFDQLMGWYDGEGGLPQGLLAALNDPDVLPHWWKGEFAPSGPGRMDSPQPSEAPPDGQAVAGVPSWWADPSEYVDAPMAIFSSDYRDLDRFVMWAVLVAARECEVEAEYLGFWECLQAKAAENQDHPDSGETGTS
ncbi:hypothetical protein LXA43DRAFT_1099196 [Ganoderma leucocontextum]|nr:hypothetical protein LXA43DRAFT_1100890 [Ganoderma leucocontextum]KAI1786484.1 hypothetical protein LXA43DRAFT_1099196 [Ganoderma leucocontextum]